MCFTPLAYKRRMRPRFFQSTFLFWVLLPAAFVPLVLESNAPRVWCGTNLGRPWHYGNFCEDRGFRIDNLSAFFGDFFFGLVVVTIVWLTVRRIFGKHDLQRR